MEDEAVELLGVLLTRYLERTLEHGKESARVLRKNAVDIRVCDLRAYPQDVLHLPVLGFSSDSLLDENNVGSRYVAMAQPPSLSSSARKQRSSSSSKGHLDRLRLKDAVLSSTLAAEQFAKTASLKKKKKSRGSKE